MTQLKGKKAAAYWAERALEDLVIYTNKSQVRLELA